MNFEQEILKAQLSQEFNINRQIAGTDEHDLIKSMFENLYTCSDRECFEKSWSGDLQKRFPNGGWRTVNGSRVFINGGKVVAGLGGFNGMIDKFFEEKKSKQTESKSSNISTKDKISLIDLSKIESDSKKMSVDELKSKIEEISKIAESKNTSDKDRVDFMLTQTKLMKELANKLKKGEISKETKQQFFELPDIKDTNDLDKNISKILSQYGNRDMASIQVEEYMKENLDIAKQWLKDKNIKSSDELKKYLKGRQGKDRKEIVGQKKESAKEWEKTKVESRVNDIVDLALQQEKQMQDKIKESDKKEDNWRDKLDWKINDSKTGTWANVKLPEGEYNLKLTYKRGLNNTRDWTVSGYYPKDKYHIGYDGGELIVNRIGNSDYKEGQKIKHKSFGVGKVTKVSGNIVTIDFEKYGTKTMMKNFLNNYII